MKYVFSTEYIKWCKEWIFFISLPQRGSMSVALEGITKKLRPIGAQ